MTVKEWLEALKPQMMEAMRAEVEGWMDDPWPSEIDMAVEDIFSRLAPILEAALEQVSGYDANGLIDDRPEDFFRPTTPKEVP